MKRWFEDVVVGDELIPDPCWNKTAGRGKQLPDRCKVSDVAENCGQSRRAFTVNTLGGYPIALDAGWFVRKAEQEG